MSLLIVLYVLYVVLWAGGLQYGINLCYVMLCYVMLCYDKFVCLLVLSEYRHEIT